MNRQFGLSCGEGVGSLTGVTVDGYFYGVVIGIKQECYNTVGVCAGRKSAKITNAHLNSCAGDGAVVFIHNSYFVGDTCILGSGLFGKCYHRGGYLGSGYLGGSCFRSGYFFLTTGVVCSDNNGNSTYNYKCQYSTNNGKRKFVTEQTRNFFGIYQQGKRALIVTFFFGFFHNFLLFCSLFCFLEI